MALDVLEAVVAGDEVTIVPTDPVTELREVFEDFMHSSEYGDMDEETRDNVTAIYISILAQGQPEVAAQLAKPLHPIQQQMAQPSMPVGPEAEAVAAGGTQGGTAAGAAQRTANQETARVYEGFDARANPGA